MNLSEQMNCLIKLSGAMSMLIDFSRKNKSYETRQLRELLYRLQLVVDEKMCGLAKLNLQEHGEKAI